MISRFIYKPPKYNGPNVQKAIVGFKFAINRVILDPWHLQMVLMNKRERILFRLRHPIIYFKRGLRNLYYRVKRLFVEDKMILARKWISRKEAKDFFPKK